MHPFCYSPLEQCMKSLQSYMILISGFPFCEYMCASVRFPHVVRQLLFSLEQSQVFIQ